jgi:hypothetical protein
MTELDWPEITTGDELFAVRIRRWLHARGERMADRTTLEGAYLSLREIEPSLEPGTFWRAIA